jgi:hypothetical protein
VPRRSLPSPSASGAVRHARSWWGPWAEDMGRAVAVAPAGGLPASPANPAAQMDEVKGPDRGKCWDVDVNLMYI